MSVPIKDSEPSPPARTDAAGPRLDSWKEIAAYLGRDVRTVQRWERREGLPVHRQQHDKLGSVYAFRHEIDAWRARAPARPEEPPADTASEPRRLWPQRPRCRRIAGVSAGSPAPDARALAISTRLALAVAIAVIVVIAVAGWLTDRQSATRGSAPCPEIRSIVVLPFENLSRDLDQEFFAAGLTEEVTARLAQLKTLRVVSRTSAMSLQGPEVPVSTIAA